MLSQILVPLAEEALPVAARLAHFSQGTLLLVRAVLLPLEVSLRLVPDEPLIRETLGEEIQKAQVYLNHIRQRPDLADLPVQTEVHCDEPAEVIRSVAETERVNLVVMSSHGYIGWKRWVPGSIARSVVHTCRAPVLVLPAGHHLPGDVSVGKSCAMRILVALDGSPQAEEILRPAAYVSAALSAPYQGTLHLVHILRITSAFEYGQHDSVAEQLEQETPKATAYLRSVAQRLQTDLLPHLNLCITVAVGHDTHVAEALVSKAEQGQSLEKQCHCDLLALVTHRKKGWQLIFKGSVANHLLSLSPLPVLVQCMRP